MLVYLICSYSTYLDSCSESSLTYTNTVDSIGGRKLCVQFDYRILETFIVGHSICVAYCGSCTAANDMTSSCKSIKLRHVVMLKPKVLTDQVKGNISLALDSFCCSPIVTTVSLKLRLKRNFQLAASQLAMATKAAWTTASMEIELPAARGGRHKSLSGQNLPEHFIVQHLIFLPKLC